MPAKPRFSSENMRRDQARAWGRVQASDAKVKSLKRMLAQAEKEFNSSLHAAADSGIPHAALAQITGVTEGRIWQLLNAWHPAKANRGKGKQ